MRNKRPPNRKAHRSCGLCKPWKRCGNHNDACLGSAKLLRYAVQDGEAKREASKKSEAS